MLENNEMIYTAIYQTSQGHLTTETYNGEMSRKHAWLAAAQLGGAKDKCLIALVPGVHPVYFYADYVAATASEMSESQAHDVFEMPPEEGVYEMT